MHHFAEVVLHMRTHAVDAVEQGRMCRALMNMTRIDANNRILAGDTGAVEAVVAAMVAHPLVEGVQREACAALGHMTCDNVQQNRTRARSAGAFEAVVAAMDTHPLVEDVQYTACAALGNMTAGSVQNRTRARSVGAVEAVVVAMVAHPLSVLLQRAACAALGHMSDGNVQNRTRMGNAGAVGALNAALASIQGTTAEDLTARDAARTLLLRLAPP